MCVQMHANSVYMSENKRNKGSRPGRIRVSAYIPEALLARWRQRAAANNDTIQDVIENLLARWTDGVPIDAPEVHDDEMAVFQGMVAWYREQQTTGQAGFWSALIEEWEQRGRRIMAAGRPSHLR